MIENRFLERDEKRELKAIKALIVHWPAGGVVDIDNLWTWMNDKSKNSYHFFVSKQRVLQIRDKSLRAIHCGHSTYTEKAIDFFGERVCSSLDSPNNYTLGICLLHDRENGSYTADTMETAVDLLSSLCFEYGLDPLTDILRHSDLTDEKRTPCPKGFFEEGDDPDDLFNEFKNWVNGAVICRAQNHRKMREVNV